MPGTGVWFAQLTGCLATLKHGCHVCDNILKDKARSPCNLQAQQSALPLAQLQVVPASSARNNSNESVRLKTEDLCAALQTLRGLQMRNHAPCSNALLHIPMLTIPLNQSLSHSIQL